MSLQGTAMCREGNKWGETGAEPLSSGETRKRMLSVFEEAAFH